MKALIFNSGTGTRLGALTKVAPKCMTAIDAEYTVIKWQLETLFTAGVEEVIITTGPFEELLVEYVQGLQKKPSVRFVRNTRYQETNYIYSMYCARELLSGDDFIILHGDLVYEEGLLLDLIKSERSAAAVDYAAPLPEKDFKAKVAEGMIRAIGIEFFSKDCHACQPMYKFLADDFQRWMQEVVSFCEAGTVKVYAENAFNAISDTISLYPLDIEGRLCKEIDNPEDLDLVSALFQKYKK